MKCSYTHITHIGKLWCTHIDNLGLNSKQLLLRDWRKIFPTFPGRRHRWGARWRFCCEPLRDFPQDASSWSPPAEDALIQHPDRLNWKRDESRQHRDSFAGKSSGDRVGDENGASLVLQAENNHKGNYVTWHIHIIKIYLVQSYDIIIIIKTYLKLIVNEIIWHL